MEPGPTGSAGERIEALDVLRGMALFGVLVVNLVGSFRVSFLEYFLLRSPGASALDRAAELAIQVLVEGKALTLFAFLFGAGLAIQHGRFERTGRPRQLLRRRLAALLAFGLAHLLLAWNGDILAQYALLGFALLPLLEAPLATVRKWIARLAVVALVLPFLALPGFFPETPDLLAEIAEANSVYGNGTYLEIRAYSAGEFLRMLPFVASLLPQTFLVMLLGVAAWRVGLLQRPGEHRATLRRVAAAGLPAGLAMGVFNLWTDAPPILGLLLVPSLTFGPIVLAMGYGAALLLALERPAVRRPLAIFAPLGRMAFTNYILQSLVFGWIFFGYGLGLFARLGTAQAVAIGLAVYAAQLALSAWWLARYRFGPLEWLWRTLTYGRAQPMRR